MAGDKPGPRSKVPKLYWAPLQQRERRGDSQQSMIEWLAGEGIEVTQGTLSRSLKRIREEAPLDGEDEALQLAPASDLDQLVSMQAQFKKESKIATEWRHRHSAANLVIRIVEVRHRLERPAAPEASTTASAPVPSGPPPLTPEQEAEAVRQQLGKRALA